jgi:hypothetical protein
MFGFVVFFCQVSEEESAEVHALLNVKEGDSWKRQAQHNASLVSMLRYQVHVLEQRLQLLKHDLKLSQQHFSQA